MSQDISYFNPKIPNLISGVIQSEFRGSRNKETAAIDNRPMTEDHEICCSNSTVRWRKEWILHSFKELLLLLYATFSLFHLGQASSHLKALGYFSLLYCAWSPLHFMFLDPYHSSDMIFECHLFKSTSLITHSKVAPPHYNSFSHNNLKTDLLKYSLTFT